MRRSPVLAVLSCSAVLLVPGVAQANPAHAVVAKVNDYRAANGLHKLKLSRSLSRSSYAYARHLMRADRFGHSSRIRASSRFRMLGENLAFSWGKRRSARIPLRGWTRSAPHRAVMLNPGSATSASGGRPVASARGARRSGCCTPGASPASSSEPAPSA